MGLFIHAGLGAVSDRDAAGAAARAGLWYKTCNESGALLVPSKQHPRPRIKGLNGPVRIIRRGKRRKAGRRS